MKGGTEVWQEECLVGMESMVSSRATQVHFAFASGSHSCGVGRDTRTQSLDSIGFVLQ